MVELSMSRGFFHFVDGRDFLLSRLRKESGFSIFEFVRISLGLDHCEVGFTVSEPGCE